MATAVELRKRAELFKQAAKASLMPAARRSLIAHGLELAQQAEMLDRGSARTEESPKMMRSARG